jgi:4-amino-4-deoxy-L-arabinose transferase-like glycosyltransferase
MPSHLRPISGLRPVELLGLAIFALACRLLLFNGLYGSDDITYYARALDVARGLWTSAKYNGALRYGFNAPEGLAMALFGHSQAVANLWPLLCSLTEVLAVAVFGAALGGRRTGLIAGILLATAPLHIAVATRIHADPVVSALLTVGVVLLYFGWLTRRTRLLLLAGVMLGGVYWAKELAAVTYFGLLPLLWFFRGRWRDVFVVLAGLASMLLLNGLMMWAIAGDPLHQVRVTLSAMQHNFIDARNGDDSANYYLRYLVVDFRHTALLGWLGLAGLAVLFRRARRGRAGPVSVQTSTYLFLGLWLVGLLTVLSVFPVSLSPLRFTMKQSNYITLFLGPLALAAAVALTALPRRLAGAALGLAVITGLGLGALQQADYRAFTANSKAVADFAIEHPGALIVGSTNNSSLGNLWANLEAHGGPTATIASFRDAIEREPPFLSVQHGATSVYAVLDPQTMNWFAGNAPVTAALPCWKPLQTLSPIDLGIGNALAGLMAASLHYLAGSRAATLASRFDLLARPAAPQVFVVPGADVWCGTVPIGDAGGHKP